MLQASPGHADYQVMQHCPGCGYLIPAMWTACRRCGAPLQGSVVTPESAMTPSSRIASIPLPPPPPPVTRPEPIPTRHDGMPEMADGMFVPRLVVAPARPSVPSRSLRGPAIALGVVALFTVATWFTIHHGSSAHAAPQVLAPRAPSAALPTNLDDVVRMRAESTRRTAMQAVESQTNAGGTVSVSDLLARQPGYQWVDANTDSKDSNVISLASNQGVVVIAVAASNHSICAFGRRQAPAAPEYVTMANMPQCRAANAPNVGWSTEPGGAASDLPDDQG